jgi:hypothetical protein
MPEMSHPQAIIPVEEAARGGPICDSDEGQSTNARICVRARGERIPPDGGISRRMRQDIALLFLSLRDRFRWCPEISLETGKFLRYN